MVRVDDGGSKLTRACGLSSDETCLSSGKPARRQLQPAPAGSGRCECPYGVEYSPQFPTFSIPTICRTRFKRYLASPKCFVLSIAVFATLVARSRLLLTYLKMQSALPDPPPIVVKNTATCHQHYLLSLWYVTSISSIIVALEGVEYTSIPVLDFLSPKR